MRAVRQAVYEWLQQQDEVLSMLSSTSAIYSNEADDSPVFPYLVFTVGSLGQIDEDTGTSVLERRSLRFQVWGNESNTVAQILDLIDAALAENMEFDIDNTSFEYAGKEDDDIFVEEDRRDGLRVWQGVLQVTIAASRDRRTSVRRT